MCLLLIANQFHKKYKLIIVANRDEFYDRPALPAHFWNNSPELLAGKDLKGGGTWLGITKGGRFAAITNYRDLKNIKPDAPSRGNLTTDFLLVQDTVDVYFKKMKSNAHLYNGFNLIFGIKNDLYYFSNQSNEFKQLEKGVYGLSNCLLDTPWPKVEKVKMKFAKLAGGNSFESSSLFNLLYDTETASDELLPDTGVGLELERLLSSIFIKSDNYGTRCSTIITIDNQDRVRFIEKTYLPYKDEFDEVEFTFSLNEQ